MQIKMIFITFYWVLKFVNFEIRENCSYKQIITPYVKSYFFSWSFTLKRSMSKSIAKI